MDNDTRTKLLQLDALYATLGDPGSDHFDAARWDDTRKQTDKLIEEIEVANPGFEVLQVDVVPTMYVARLRWALVPKEEEE